MWNFDYNANGMPTHYSHPNGMLTQYAYDNQNRLTDIEHMDGMTVKQGFAYTFDDNSNVASVTHEDGSSWAYTYDGRDRLTLAIRYDASAAEEYREAYTYDPGDNLLTKTVTEAGQSPVTTTYTVNDANELLTQSDGATSISYTYDAAGRQAAKTDGTYTTINNWRFADMLYKVESDDPAVPDVTYEYGGNGLKRSRETDTEYDWYNWSGLQLIQAEDAQGALTDTYVHHPFRIWGSALADISGSAPGTGTARYFTHDMLGSTRGVWDGAKASLGTWEPTPFGETYTSTLPSDILHQFTGQVYDPVTELNYFSFRHYGPGQSRWLSPEPFGFDGPNLYWYGLGNPSSMVDAFGLMGRGTKLYDKCGHPSCKENKPLKLPKWLKNLLNGLGFGLTNAMAPPNPLSPEGAEAAGNAGHIFKNLREREEMLEDMGMPRDNLPIDGLLEDVGLPPIKPPSTPTPRPGACGAGDGGGGGGAF